MWFHAVKREATTWGRFLRLFKYRFVQAYNREDLHDDLRHRTQGKGENITPYLASLKYIVSRFTTRPPHESVVVDIAWKNIFPDYCKAMSEKLVDILSILEEYVR